MEGPTGPPFPPRGILQPWFLVFHPGGLFGDWAAGRRGGFHFGWNTIRRGNCLRITNLLERIEEAL